MLFDIEERCLKTENFDCDEKKFTKKGEDAKHWPDSPADTWCGPKAENDQKKCLVMVPTFWTRQRLDTITTEVATAPGAGTYREVDQWKLTQKFLHSKYDTAPPLWLEGIKRTGHSTDKAASLPSVLFHANAD